MYKLLVHGLVLFAVVLTLETTAQAVILSHSGASDPRNDEGWTQKDLVPFPANVTAGVAPDSTPSWRISDASGSGNGFYQNTFTAGDLPSGSAWVQTVKLRVQSNSNEFALFSYVYDGSTFFHFYYTTGKLRYLNSAGQRADLLAVDNNSDFRTYKFAYDPNADQLSISVDGVFQTSLARSAFFNAANTPGQAFGAGDYGGQSDSRWATVSLVIPEPASFALMSLAGLLFVARRRGA